VIALFMHDKPYAPAAERNRDPILHVLRDHLARSSSVLEIGSGTGQHAVHFALNLPHLIWQSSDRAHLLPGIRAWLTDAALHNTPAPLEIDVDGEWPTTRFDAIFSANTLHIMSWQEVESMFAKLPGVMNDAAHLIVYGPFKYAGRHTSESNASFDASLRHDAPHRAIRDFDDVDRLARAIGCELIEDRAMPANNRCIVWRKC